MMVGSVIFCLRQQEGLGKITASVGSPSNGRSNFSLLTAPAPRDGTMHKILIIGLHQDIAGAQVDLIFSNVSAYYQELIRELAAFGNLQ